MVYLTGRWTGKSMGHSKGHSTGSRPTHRHGGMELISFILIAFSNSEETIATVELSRESIATVNVAVDEILPFVTGLQMRMLYVILETGAKGIIIIICTN
jgi:hypothetical protein